MFQRPDIKAKIKFSDRDMLSAICDEDKTGHVKG